MSTEFTPDEEALMSRPESGKGAMQRACLRLLRVHEREESQREQVIEYLRAMGTDS